MTKKIDLSEIIELNNPFSGRIFHITDDINEIDAMYKDRIRELQENYLEIETLLLELSEMNKCIKNTSNNNELQPKINSDSSLSKLNKMEDLIVNLSKVINKETLSNVSFIETSHLKTTNILSNISDILVSVFKQDK
ncbi:hypothetical protein [Vibrio furnissii]|uniref:hypothetical protein n=1 Tax=Vibrio furnissii TaxID=29494 RepID=UPI001EEA00E5|nr:hypothetical protein [Vibrio furnissii]